MATVREAKASDKDIFINYIEKANVMFAGTGHSVGRLLMAPFTRTILNKLNYSGDDANRWFFNRNLDSHRNLSQHLMETEGNFFKNIIRTEWVSGDGRCFLYALVHSMMYQICSMAQHPTYLSSGGADVKHSALMARLVDLIEIYGSSPIEKQELKSDLSSVIELPYTALSWTEHVKSLLTHEFEEKWAKFLINGVLVTHLEQTPSVVARSHPMFEKFLIHDWMDFNQRNIRSYAENATNPRVDAERAEYFETQAAIRRDLMAKIEGGEVNIASIFRFYYEDAHPSSNYLISLLTEAMQYDVSVWTFTFIGDWEPSFYAPSVSFKSQNWIEEELFQSFVNNPLEKIHILNSGIVYDPKLKPDQQQTISHFYPVIIGATATYNSQQILLGLLKQQPPEQQQPSSPPPVRHPPSTPPSSALEFRNRMLLRSSIRGGPHPTTPISAKRPSTVS